MLTEIYISALLVDDELADQVWDVWDKGEIDDQVAWLDWWTIAQYKLECRLPTVHTRKKALNVSVPLSIQQGSKESGHVC